MAEGGVLEDCPRRQKWGRMGMQHGVQCQMIFWKCCALLYETRPVPRERHGVLRGPDDGEEAIENVVLPVASDHP
jgi:hypothetical protein